MGIRYTKLADPLLDFIDTDIANTAAQASSLLTPIIYNADLFANDLQWFTGNYGFDGYLGVPGLQSANAQQAAADFNVAWETVNPDLNPPLRALTSAGSVVGSTASYGTNLLLADTMPLVFSYPVLPTTLNGDGSDFLVTVNDGTQVTPQAAGFLPNLEYNERQTIVIIGDFGNRLKPGSPGAKYPINVTIVNDGTPLQMISAAGPVDAVSLTIDSSNPYVEGNGPRLVAAKLNHFSNLGEGGPSGIGASSQDNSGGDLYGDQAQYRLRLYTSAGFSPDGIASLMPDEFSRYFQLQARTDDDITVILTEEGVAYEIGNQGSITIVGMADLAPTGTPVNAAYVEDHDNYYDLILKGDRAAIERLTAVRMPSVDSYSPVYNPGGPGNDPDAPGAAPGPFTVPSQDHSIPISFDLNGTQQTTFVEIEGKVLANPFNSLPVGELLGIAVEDTVTGQTIKAYQDPNGRRFYSSFKASPAEATNLPGGRRNIQSIDLIDTRGFEEGSNITLSGTLSRSADDNSILQWYEVADAAGTILDPASGVLLKPEEAGYRIAAKQRAALISGTPLELSNTTITSFSLSLEAGALYAPLVTNQRSDASYFAFAAANMDGLEHFTSFGANRWGVEDLFGSGDSDFDDMILSFSLDG